MRVSADVVRELVVDVLVAWGMDQDLAETTAEVVVGTDLAGIDSHGVSMLMTYEQFRAQGRLDLRARPTVVREDAASALVDAHGGLGHPASEQAMRLAIDKASAGTVGVVSVVNSHHFGAAGHYAEMAARRGLIGLVTSSANLPASPPTGSVVPVLATNPIAFAAPARRNPHFLLDIATTTAAVNKVKVYDFQGRPLPEGWVVDADARPVTDSHRALNILRHEDVGGLTPLGGTPELGSHKGYGLSVMAHVLAATLCGGAFPASRAPEDPHNIGHFFLALDPSGFRPPGEFEDDLDDAIDHLHATPPLNPDEPVLVAGDPQAAAREDRSRNGIPMPDSLVEQLRGVAERAGVTSALQEVP
ncbi:Ldh family oxidoreductase [Saccharopolyspora rhizosphaerae]|uniref:Ldh family oxidoreductase n=1 Tax=Saccharopolyspora rhizosphaerae TaxID=2492662 RepID=A0A3R8P4P1_9PSEU|nr:Ldh family oxidoreductase [Saccharopolyspora rhizosphaerae]RRO16253.1 Ldh family oxidoreductase [Saccharopolyspora rhizosphaerae]